MSTSALQRSNNLQWRLSDVRASSVMKVSMRSRSCNGPSQMGPAQGPFSEGGVGPVATPPSGVGHA